MPSSSIVFSAGVVPLIGLELVITSQNGVTHEGVVILHENIEVVHGGRAKKIG